MFSFKYRIYLDGANYSDIVIQAQSQSIGQQLLESQYQGRQIMCLGMVN